MKKAGRFKVERRLSSEKINIKWLIKTRKHHQYNIEIDIDDVIN